MSLEAQTGPAGEWGRPLLRTWGPKEYRASPQVARVGVDAAGVVHVLSANYLIRFDGVEFVRTEMPVNHSRAMAFGPEGAVYVGGTDDIGVVRADELGRYGYRSLMEGMPEASRQFGVVWEAAAVGAEVWFSAERHVLRWRGGKVETWAFTNGPGTTGILVSGTNVFAQTTGVGLRHFDGRDFVTVSTNALVVRGLVVGMAPASAGGWWVLSRSAGLLHWDGVGVRTVPLTGADTMLAGRPAQLDVLPDGRLLVATSRGGLFLVNPASGVERRWHVGNGLASDAVRDVAIAGDGTWWLATDLGFQAVDLPLAATVFDERDGLSAGLCNGLLRHDGRLVLSLLDGIHELWPAQGTNAATWRKHPHSIHYAQECVSDGGGLLVGDERGLHRLSREVDELVFPVTGGVLALTRIPGDPDRLLGGLRDGAVVLRRNGVGWEQQRRFEGLGEVRNIVLAPDGTAWLASTARGAHQIIPAAGTGSERWEKASVRTFNRANGGLAEGQDYVQVWALPDGPRVVGEQRLWQTTNAGARLVEDTGIRGPAGPLHWISSTAPADADAFWGNAAYLQSQEQVDFPIARFERSAADQWSAKPSPSALGEVLGFIGAIRTLREAAPSGEIVWARGMENLVRLEPRQWMAEARPWAVRLTGFLASGTNQALGGARGPLKHGRQPYVFHFGTGRADRGAGIEYQVRLVGWDEQWGAYSPRREATWSGLPGGDYRFEVRGRDRAGHLSSVGSLSFEVATPWYLTGWAWVGYLLVGGVGFQGAVRWRVRRAEARANDLECQVAERTRELAAARDVAEEASRAKSRFLANMSHELRTPLNGILGFTQILARDTGMNDRNRERLRVIRSSGDHLLGLINDVLDLARVEAGRVELRAAPFRPSELLRDLEASFRPHALERGLALEFEWVGSRDEVRMGDRQRLRQVLENLVGNALKFTQKGRVQLRAESAGDHLRFRVIDTGPGMAAGDLARLFQPFSQAVTGRPAEAGAGLGLSISQHLVGLMGGRIEVESILGRGSEFRFEIPLPTTSPPLIESATRGPVTGYSGRRCRVLIVDDVEINRRLLREWMEPLGFILTESASGEAAMECIRHSDAFDLVILDLRMPGMDGLELTRHLRQEPRFQGRILAMSASVLGFGRADALAAGADDFVGKPFREEALLDALGTLLGLSWERGPLPTASSGPVDEGKGDESGTPPGSVLEPLRAAAARGDIVGFRTALAAARSEAPDHEAFYQSLEILAAAYRMAALRDQLDRKEQA